jgi:hypothetical protein
MKASRMLVAALTLMGVIALVSGCSSEQTSTTTTRTTVAGDSSSAQAPAPSAATTTTTTSSNEPDSVLGATFHLVGTIILLPFRIIGLLV